MAPKPRTGRPGCRREGTAPSGKPAYGASVACDSSGAYDGASCFLRPARPRIYGNRHPAQIRVWVPLTHCAMQQMSAATARHRSAMIHRFPAFEACRSMVSFQTRFLIAAALVLSASPATAAPWVRGFVVDNYEPAFYYGGRSGTEERGPDCPKGTIPILDYKTVLKTSWRTQAEIDKITLPVSAGGLGERVVSPAMTHRGFRRDIDTYVNPFT